MTIQQPLERLVFFSRWVQAPMYVGLIVAQIVYCWLFLVELFHLIARVFGTGHIDETDVMLTVLGLVDIVMIANLLIMVIIGGYQTFVSKLDEIQKHPDQPEWLAHINAGVLKIKLSTAIISISSIHLLKSFINPNNQTEHYLKWQVIIHLLFLISALALAWVDKIMMQTVLNQHSHS